MQKRKYLLMVLLLAFICSLALFSCGKKKSSDNNDDNSDDTGDTGDPGDSGDKPEGDPNVNGGYVVDKEKPSYYLSLNVPKDVRTSEFEFESVASYQINEKDTLKELPTPEKSGYNFGGWYTEGYSVENYYKTMPSYALNLYARYELPQDTLYVAPSGLPTNEGKSYSKPLDIYTAVFCCRPGATIRLAEGQYNLSKPLQLIAMGSAKKPIKIIGSTEGNGTVLNYIGAMYNGVDNFDSMPENDKNIGVKLIGDYYRISNITVKGAGDNGMLVGSDGNIIENCVFTENKDTGLQIARNSGNSQVDVSTWPSNNLILNCTSFNNIDSGCENADGFAAKLTVGEGNVFDGCISYWNIDDGWDLFAKADSGSIGQVTIRNCIAYQNGNVKGNGSIKFKNDEQVMELIPVGELYTPTSGADGNGFKLGGTSMPGRVIVDNCIAAYNNSHGFTDNSNPGVIAISNCTSYNNGQKGATYDKEYDNFNLNRTQMKANRNYYKNLLSYYDESGLLAHGPLGGDEFNGSTSNSIFYYNESCYKVNGSGVLYAYDGFEDSKQVSEYSYASSPLAKGGNLDSMFSTYGFNIHDAIRNDDNTFNLGNLWKVTLNDSIIGIIGADLSKSAYSDYSHTDKTTISADLSDDKALATLYKDYLAISILQDQVYNDFFLPTTMNVGTIAWSSNNTDVLAIEVGTAGATAKIKSKLAADTVVQLTATITVGTETITKLFEITCKAFDPRIGTIVKNVNEATILNSQDIPDYSKITIYDFTDNSVILEDGHEVNVLISVTYQADEDSTPSDVDKVSSTPGIYNIKYTLKVTAYPDIISESKITIVDSTDTLSIKSVDTGLGYILENKVNLNVETSYYEGTLYALAVDNTSNAPTQAEILEAANGTSFDGLVSDVKKITLADLKTNVVLTLNSSYASGSTVQIYLMGVNANGNGTIKEIQNLLSPIKITTANQLRDELLSTDSKYKAYELANDIDCANTTWTQGSKNPFAGYFNGNFYTISNLTINNTVGEGGGLFQSLTGDVVIKNVELNKVNVKGAKKVGILAGSTNSGGTITNIKITNSSVLGDERVAGLIGEYTTEKANKTLLIKNIEISNDTTDYNRYFIKAKSGKYVGGIIAHIQNNMSVSNADTIIEDVFVNRNVYMEIANQFIGGIVGRFDTKVSDCNITVNRAFFAGIIYSSQSYCAGILAGRNSGTISITNCVTTGSITGPGFGMTVSQNTCTKTGISPDQIYSVNETYILWDKATCLYSVADPIEGEEDNRTPEEIEKEAIKTAYYGTPIYSSELCKATVWTGLGFDLTDTWTLGATYREFGLKAFID